MILDSRAELMLVATGQKRPWNSHGANDNLPIWPVRCSWPRDCKLYGQGLDYPKKQGIN